MTFPISLNRGRTKAAASCTASFIALIPVFIRFERLLSDGHKNQKMRSILPPKQPPTRGGGFYRKLQTLRLVTSAATNFAALKPRLRLANIPPDLLPQRV